MKIGLSSQLYKTCILCNQQKHCLEFFHLKKNGKRKKRTFCNQCRDSFPPDEIVGLINQKLNPPIKDIGLDIESLSSEVIYLFGYNHRYKMLIDKKTALIYVQEGAAYVKNFQSILLRHDNKKLKEFILNRDHYKCYSCGNNADRIERIITKEQGGLKTPGNMRTVCLNCSRHQQQLNMNKKSKNKFSDVHYAIPVFLNHDAVVYSAIENPKSEFLKVINDNQCVHFFCDVSEHPDGGLYGLAVIIAGKNINGIQIRTKPFLYVPNQSSFAELTAIHFALRLINNLNSQCSDYVIYTDTDIWSMNKPRNENIHKLLNTIKQEVNINTTIRYLDNKLQRNPFYRMAHNFSRISCRQVKHTLS